MTSSPAISPVSVVMVGMMLGPLYLATYASVALVGSFVIGLIGNRLLRDQTRPVENCSGSVELLVVQDR